MKATLLRAIVPVLLLGACSRTPQAPESVDAQASAQVDASAASSSAPIDPLAGSAPTRHTLSNHDVSSAADAGADGGKAPLEPPSTHAAKAPFVLGTTGLTVTPTLRYKVTPREYAWMLDLASGHEEDTRMYLMKKMFAPKDPVGEVVPCANKSDYVPKKQADGSFVYQCTGRGSGDGTWFARVLGTTDPKLPSLICSGSSKEPRVLREIEATCRSIALKK